GLSLVRATGETLQFATASRGRTRRSFLDTPGLYRPQRSWGLEGGLAHDHRSVAGPNPLHTPAVPFGSVLMQPLNPGHERSPGYRVWPVCDSALRPHGDTRFRSVQRAKRACSTKV